MATQPTEQNDTLTAGLGIKTIDGLGGTDTLIIDYSTLTRNIYNPYLTLTDYLYNSVTYYNIEKWNIKGGIGDDTFSGGSSADTLIGGAGWDYITGNGGADSIDGGTGIDTWKDDYSAATSVLSITLTATAGGNSSTTLSLGSLPTPTVKNVEALNIHTGSGNDTVSVGNFAYNDAIYTGSGNDSINVGKGGADYVDGGVGIDLGIFDWSASTTDIFNPNGNAAYYDDYSDSEGRSVNFDNIERFNMTGGSGNDDLAGDVNNDTLLGGAGRDTLNGGRGADTINGNDGVDLWKADYSSSTVAIKVTLVTTELNEVNSGITGAVVKNIERLEFTSGSGNDSISAGTFAFNDSIYTNGGDDSINVGKGGSDYVDGGAGTDLGIFNWSASTTDISNPNGNAAYYDDYSDSEGRYVNFDNVERFDLTGGLGNDYLAGAGFIDKLFGGAGRDTLEGASGSDNINGGGGVDLWKADYSASSASIKVTLNSSLTTNEVLAGIKGAKVFSVERLEFTAGSGNDSISAGTLANNDWISSGSGDDTINVGTGGSDYVNGGDGLDLGLFDWSASTTDIFNPNNNTAYYDDYSDSEGRFVNFDNVERFNITGGSGNDDLAGDSWNDTLIGNGGNDSLNSGNLRTDVESFNTDSVDGGDGIDYWLADFSLSSESINILLSNNPTTNEVLSGITDSVTSAVEVVKNIEHMNFRAGSGNDTISSGTFAYDDQIYAGNGSDEINVGTGGNDYVDGGDGIDIGIFDWSGSTTRISSDSYYDDFSDLEGRHVNFDSVDRFNVMGGSGSDYLAGDAYSDTLAGGAGDDELDGYGGDDTLTGGTNSDTFNIRSGNGMDVITDFGAGLGAGDLVHFINNPFTTMSFDAIQQNMVQDGADTVLTLSVDNSIRFVGVNVGDFVADDFLWA